LIVGTYLEEKIGKRIWGEIPRLSENGVHTNTR